MIWFSLNKRNALKYQFYSKIFYFKYCSCIWSTYLTEMKINIIFLYELVIEKSRRKITGY
jgi:hypothetical protein